MSAPRSSCLCFPSIAEMIGMCNCTQSFVEIGQTVFLVLLELVSNQDPPYFCLPSSNRTTSLVHCAQPGISVLSYPLQFSSCSEKTDTGRKRNHYHNNLFSVSVRSVTSSASSFLCLTSFLPPFFP